MSKNFFGHSWIVLPMIFTHDCITRENCLRISLIMTKKIIIYGKPYTNLCIINEARWHLAEDNSQKLF